MPRKTGRPAKPERRKVRRLLYFTPANLRWLELRAARRSISAGEFVNLLVESAQVLEREGK